MKVLHVGKYLPPAKGGMESSILSLCQALSHKKDCEVVLVGTHAQEPREVTPASPFKMLSMKNWVTVASTPLVTGLCRILQEEKPDLVHVHLPNPWITLLLRSWRGPLVATYHCDVMSFPILKKMYSPVLNSFLHQCQSVIATSAYLSKTSEELKKFQQKVKIIPLSIEPLTISLGSEQKIKALRTLAKEKMILFVGRLVSYKGLGYLVEAMKSVDGYLVIVGEGPEKENLLALIQRLDLRGKISLAGYVSDADLPSYYEAARVVALPSVNESEAFGICLIEALSMARPLVTTNLPTGVSHVNKAGETGLSVPVRDSKSLAEALRQILDNPQKWQMFSENALRHFQTNFSLDGIADSHIELYHQALNV